MEFIMSLKINKVNCLVCRGTKKVDKIGGLHTKECPGCNGAGKVEKNPLEGTGFDPGVIVAALHEEIAEPVEDKTESVIKPKEGSLKNGKRK